MAHVQIETIPGIYNVVCFPKEWERYGGHLNVGMLMMLKVGTTKDGDLVLRMAKEIR